MSSAGHSQTYEAEPAPDARLTLRDRWKSWRSNVIASPRFRRLAARNALTRAVARRETATLFDLTAGFVYSQVLFSFVRLGLPEMLAGKPLGTAAIAAACRLPEARALTLLKAAAALGLSETRSAGRWGLGAVGAALIDNPGVRAMIEHHALLYRDLADPVALLRQSGPTELSRFWAYGAGGSAEADAYSRLMAASQDFIAGEILDAIAFRPGTSLLDVGGGSGAFAEAALRRHAQLRATVFDLPQVVEGTRRRLHGAGLGGRIDVLGGSFLHDTLPQGFDTVTLVRVLHDHDDEAAATLLSAVRRSLPQGGRLIVAEPMAGTPGAERAGDAYFGIYLTAMRSGRPRRFDEIAAMLKTAGFASIREIGTANPLLVRIAQASA